MVPVEAFTTVPDPFDDPGVRQVLDANRLGGQIPQAPMYLYHGSSQVFLGDEFIPESGVLALQRQWCAGGANVTYVPVWGEHLTAAIAGAPGMLDWIADRLAGVPAPQGARETATAQDAAVSESWVSCAAGLSRSSTRPATNATINDATAPLTCRALTATAAPTTPASSAHHSNALARTTPMTTHLPQGPNPTIDHSVTCHNCRDTRSGVSENPHSAGSPPPAPSGP